MFLIIFLTESTNAIDISKNLNSFCTTTICGAQSIKSDLEQFQLNGQFSIKLLEFSKKLLSISPVSTSCERCFSTCGQYLTKTRNSLGSDTLDCLIILKHFYSMKS